MTIILRHSNVLVKIVGIFLDKYPINHFLFNKVKQDRSSDD